MAEKSNNNEMPRTTRAGGVETYYGGKLIEVAGFNVAIDEKIKGMVSEIKKGRRGYVFFDLDGTLIESGLETAGNSKTIKQWAEENVDEIRALRNNVKRLQDNGLSVGLSTGRGLEFCKRLTDEIFPEESGIKLDENIVEGGLFIYNQETGNLRLSPSVDTKSAEMLGIHHDQIVLKMKELGMVIEGGKMRQVSANPPIVDGKRDTDLYDKLLRESLPKEVVDLVLITHSSSAVDVTPFGVDKMTALRDIVGDGIAAYAGDGKNDETAMSDSGVVIVLVPENAHSDIKDYAKNNVNNERRHDKIGLVSSKGKDLSGINRSLRLLSAGIKVYGEKVA